MSENFGKGLRLEHSYPIYNPHFFEGEWQDLLNQYLGVEPFMGFSIAFRIMIAVTKVNIDHITINRIQTFFADSKNGMDHIPTKVQT